MRHAFALATAGIWSPGPGQADRQEIVSVGGLCDATVKVDLPNGRTL